MLKEFLVALKSIQALKAFFKKYQRLIAYLIFGALTTLVNLVSFYLLDKIFLFATIPATIISWLFAIIFAFITNKFWVFKSKANTFKSVIRELISFFLARLTTLGSEVLIMWIMVDLFQQESLIWKLICNIITIILNYLFSVLFVFKGKDKTKVPQED